MAPSPPPRGVFRSGGTKVDAANQIPPIDPFGGGGQPSKGAGFYGNKRTRGSFYEEPLGELDGINGIDVYDRMRRVDSVIKGLLAVRMLPLLSADWQVEINAPTPEKVGAPGEPKANGKGGAPPSPPPKKRRVFSWLFGLVTGSPPTDTEPEEPSPEHQKAEEIRAFVERALFERPDRPFHTMLAESLLYLLYGFMVQYVAWKTEKDDDGKTRVFLKDLYMRHPRSILASAVPWVFSGDKLVGVTQTDVYNGQGTVTLSREEIIILTNQQEGGNYQGISDFRSDYRPYIAKGRLMNILNLGLERLAVGIVVAKLNMAGDIQGRGDELFQAGENVRSGEVATIVLQAEEELDTLHGELKAAELMDALKFFNAEMTKGHQAEFMELGTTGNTGGYALSADKTDLYLLGEEAVAGYVAGQIQTDIIRRLVKLNFGEEGLRYCPSLHAVIRKETKQAIADMLLKLVSGDVITFSEVDEDDARAKLDLPPRTLPRPTPQEKQQMEIEKAQASRPPVPPGGGSTGGNQPPSATKKPDERRRPVSPLRKA